MFNFLKDKIKNVVSKFSSRVEEESKIEEKAEEIKEVIETKKEPKKINKQEKEKLKKGIKLKKEVKDKKSKEVKLEELEKKEDVKVEEVETKQESKGFFAKLKDKFAKKSEEEISLEKPKEEHEIKELTEEKSIEISPMQVEEKKSFFSSIKEKITTTKISRDKFNEFFDELEITMLENNVALEVIDKIKEDLVNDLLDKPIKRNIIEETIISSLKESIEDLFLVNKFDLIQKINDSNKKPYVICFLGQNGSGKTTSIAKVSNYLKKNNKSVVLAAADTFRAASIEQIKEWGSRLNVKVIAHDYGSDPAAVCFDAIEYAKSHNLDLVLIDTAGRQHSNFNLMKEMEKIVRIAKPDLKIFVGESITGNDAIEQSQDFNKSIGIDGIILTKADIDEKGGTIISVSFVTHRPIIFLGVGQNLDDLKEFSKDEILEKIGLN